LTSYQRLEMVQCEQGAYSADETRQYPVHTHNRLLPAFQRKYFGAQNNLDIHTIPLQVVQGGWMGLFLRNIILRVRCQAWKS